MRSFRERLGRELLLIDGAMGTMLQERGLGAGELPGRMNLRAAQTVRGIHEEYIAAGADIVTTNTFGASRLKFGDEVESVIRAGVRIAREAVTASGRHAYVAADIGPLGKLLRPVGDLAFEDAVGLFAEIVRACEGADLLLLETFTDLYELKAALLAAKEASDLPVVAMLTFDEAGRMLTGADVTGAAITADHDGTVELAAGAASGQQVYKGQLLASIHDLSAMNVVAEVDEIDLERVHVGDTLTVVFDCYPQEEVSGTVKSISLIGNAKQNATYYDVTISISTSWQVLPGMNATVRLPAGQ